MSMDQSATTNPLYFNSCYQTVIHDSYVPLSLSIDRLQGERDNPEKECMHYCLECISSLVFPVSLSGMRTSWYFEMSVQTRQIFYSCLKTLALKFDLAIYRIRFLMHNYCGISTILVKYVANSPLHQVKWVEIPATRRSYFSTLCFGCPGSTRTSCGKMSSYLNRQRPVAASRAIIE